MGSRLDHVVASFGERPRAPRPILLTIAFGVLLVIVGVTAMSQALMVSVYASSAALQTTVESDLATVRGFVYQGLDQRIATGVLPPADLARLQGLIATIKNKGEILHVELRSPDGTIVASSDASAVGVRAERTPDFEKALGEGTVQVTIAESGASEVSPGASLASPQVLREYMPLSIDGSVVLVVSIWRDAVPILARIDALRANVVVMTISAALIAALVLYLVFRGAQGRITRQSLALMEAARRDPLTGTLNHGALVEGLAAQIEQARAAGVQIGVALLDVDGFRLLNESHGHLAGDDALLLLTKRLNEIAGDDLLMGRYGPDEFLLALGNTDAEGLEPTVRAIVAALAATDLQYESTDRLPITISAGLVTYPLHGASVTTLLSAAVRTLDEAKASGGNAVHFARPEESEPGVASTFDVLKGLVLAVDTKDRYTKRHSEDVARYSMFIAQLMELDDEAVRAIQMSGLLHDIGKIGIPDEILRKPGKLTASEMAVIQRHVELGDMIVRELPNLEEVRAGIRHHHERWDGRGYLAGLKGEDTPLIARILAVADSFSAMTTTRPYRKALDLREAIARLGDAAGTQLDEQIVKVFLDGLEHAADPPLPGREGPRIWVPLRTAA